MHLYNDPADEPREAQPSAGSNCELYATSP
jgi:hypothetical protein